MMNTQNEKKQLGEKAEFRRYQRRAIQAAKDLFYPEYVIRRLYKAKTQSEVKTIMTGARKKVK